MSNIKINDIPQRVQYAATNGQTQFTIPFPFFNNTYVIVWQDGIQLFPGGSPGQYAISGAGSPSGGLITLVSPATLDSIITIQGEMPIDRTSIYSATISNLTGSDLNGDFNREVVMMKQIQTTQAFLQLQYAPWALVSQDLDVTRDRYIPILGEQQVWRMNEAGTAIEPFTIGGAPAPTDSPYLTYTADATLESAQNIGLLASGLLKSTVVAGVATVARAIPNVDYLDASVPLGTMAFQNANNVNITAGVANLTAGQVASSPTFANDLVNKAYADSISAGFTFKAAVICATTANLSATYANGASGVGATLTEVGNGVFTVDGISPTILSRVLVKNQSTTANNGIYTVTNAGSAGTPYILTRATDFDSPSEIAAGSIIFVQTGTTLANTSWVQTNPVVTVGTDPIQFIQFSQQYPLSMGNGGTGASITPVNNSLVYSNATNMTLLAPQNSMVLTSSVAGLPTWATTLPAGLTIPTPKIAQINDAAGLAMFTMTATASAVNNWEIINSATGTPVRLAPIGTDSNIGAQFLTKGTGLMEFKSANTTTPFSWLSGTSYQHITNWTIPNTSATRTVTLQDADGTMAYLADRGWVLLGTANASSSADIQFLNLTGYSNYMAVFNCLTPGTSGSILYFQGSINNGSAWLFTPPVYLQQSLFYTNATLLANQDTTTLPGGVMSGNILSGNPGPSGQITFENMGGSTRKGYNGTTTYISSAVSLMGGMVYNGWIANTNPINAIRFIMSAGVIVSGTVQMYGMK